MTGMIDCQAVMRQLWAYLDGELSVERIPEIQGHLAMCARCHPQFEFERAFLEQLGRARREHSDLDALRSRLVGALATAGFAAP